MRPLRRNFTGVIVIASSIASVLPLFFLWRHFQFLFFFHDDWLMLDGLDRLGLGRWLFEPFAGEGVFPLFKILWWGALRLTGGSYLGMTAILWMTHAAICLLFGWLLERFSMEPAAIGFALLTFGLAWTNIETLGWFMQWNALLSMLFFLAAWHVVIENGKSRSGPAACFVCLVAAALCSSRGIIAGVVLAVFVLVENAGEHRARRCLLCLAPTVLVTAIAWLFAPHHQFAAGATLRYASEYLILNPLFFLLPFLRVKFEAGNLVIFGLIKTAVFIWAFRKATPSARPLLWTLVALDLFFAASIGYARWPTGLPTATSSRYQYIPLFCFGPMAGTLLARLRPGAQIATAFLSIVLLALPWNRHIEQWSTGRGKIIRSAIAQDDPGQSFDPSSITAGRARDLLRRYGLH